MNLAQLLEQLKADERFLRHVTRWEVIQPRAARTVPFPEVLDPRLGEALRRRGVTELYSHQGDAVALAAGGRSFVVPTPTASGKTLCYNLPVLDAIARDEAKGAR